VLVLGIIVNVGVASRKKMTVASGDGRS